MNVTGHKNNLEGQFNGETIYWSCRNKNPLKHKKVDKLQKTNIFEANIKSLSGHSLLFVR